ncbi:hypothetical protein [uncultured Prochlorococcus sp.]|uniref:hypothetical protein n=1 Tax=uncultured Prochlorococcus sp. TaxID=159733 RepID=UPI002584C483|nr:hypothetical protein [uncultured Prochlorococcus sp.]
MTDSIAKLSSEKTGIYQNVICKRDLDALNSSNFQEQYNSIASQDPYLRNINNIKLRTHFILHYFDISYALLKNLNESQKVKCCFMGVRHGTVASVISNLRKENVESFFLIDNFKDINGFDIIQNTKNNLNSNTNGKFKLYFIKGFLPEAINDLSEDKFNFLHINLGDPTWEIESFKKFIPKLSSYSVCIIDNYGFYPKEKRKELRNLLEEKKIYYTELPTLQICIMSDLN